MRQQYHIRRVGEDTLIWDVHRLVELSQGLQVFALPLSDLAELDENWWYAEPSDLPTPRSIAKHVELIAQCDGSYAIILCAEGRLMDGMHRAVKALANGDQAIDAVRFSRTPAPDFMNVSLSSLPYGDDDTDA